jgi:sarcosine oxidase
VEVSRAIVHTQARTRLRAMHTGVAVVGAGIVGLSIAYEAQRAGADVLCLDPAPGTAQSTGPGRIFRLAHDAPGAVTRARAALDGWARWEAEFAKPFVDHRGCLVIGDDARAHAHAIDTAEAEGRFVADGELLGIEDALRIGGWPTLLDPAGGVIDAVAVIASLVSQVRPRSAAVTRIESGGAAARVVLEDADVVTADHVVVAAGIATPALTRQSGPQVPAHSLYRHARFTVRPAGPLRNLTHCFLDRRRSQASGGSFYGFPLPGGLMAIGGGWGEGPFAADATTPESVRAASWREVRAWLIAHGEEAPEALDTVECVHPRGAPSDDPYAFEREGPVVAVHGQDLFKFAPQIGADAVALLASGDVGIAS